MVITVQLFASLQDCAGFQQTQVHLPEGSRVGDLTRVLISQFPALTERLPHVRVAVNEEYAGSEATLSPGDEVSLIPPVSGGRHA